MEIRNGTIIITEDITPQDLLDALAIVNAKKDLEVRQARVTELTARINQMEKEIVALGGEIKYIRFQGLQGQQQCTNVTRRIALPKE